MKKTINSTMRRWLLFTCCIPLTVLAQKGKKTDSLAPIREFLQVSSAYRQMPLYLELEMNNSTNLVMGEQDTLHASGKFYLLPQSSYMQFGELEQLVTDSIAIMISSRMQRIIINANPQPLRNQLQAFSGLMLKDSSVRELSKKFKSRVINDGEMPVIELDSRSLLYGTSFPKETIEMYYDAKTKKPTKMVALQRRSLPLTNEDYQTIKSQPGMERFLLSIEGKGYFLVKEQATAFVYKTVTQGTAIKIPVAVSDRIVKNTNGEFEPVKAFEDYEIINN